MDAQETWVVKVEGKRLQGYLFKDNELKSMVGANALLGEVFRGQLLPSKKFAVTVGEDAGAKALEEEPTADNLPALAVHCGAFLPVKVDALPLGEPVTNDPLDGDDRDDPRAAYSNGVLVRDASRVHAIFPDAGAADRFIRHAHDVVARRLPGLLLTARRQLLSREPGNQPPLPTPQEKGGEAPLDLPQFQVCQVAGQGPASHRDRREGERDEYYSESAHEKRKKAVAFDRGRTYDVLGLIRRAILRELGLEEFASRLEKNEKEGLFPNDFDHVARSGYLAVVTADGNGIGKRSEKWRKPAGQSGDFFQREARGEQFYRAMRGGVRRALLAALGATFRPAADRILQEVGGLALPFRLMMQGGDDLLLVCDAVYAARFLVNYAKQLGEVKMVDEEPLDVAAGVAVVKKTFPFHRAHALAEQLQDSAKRRYRERPEGGSTVDWLAISEAWHEDVKDARRRDARKTYALGATQETLVLSRKPYPILGAGESLQTLCDAAEKAVGLLARGQSHALAEAVTRGRLQGEWAVMMLDKKAWDALAPGVQPGVQPDKARRSPWRESEGPTVSTSLIDFLELFELENLRQALDAPARAGGEE